MKNMTRVIVFLLVALATPVIYGSDTDRGVGEIDVIVKQRPRDRAVTDGRGNFAIEALAAGSYTVTFRPRKAENFHQSTSDKAIVATVFSIKINGTKHPVNKTGITSDDLIAGVDINVDLGPGARIHGQVTSGALKKMVWLSREPGSNLPGHWAEADSAEAKAALHHNTSAMSIQALQQVQR